VPPDVRSQEGNNIVYAGFWLRRQNLSLITRMCQKHTNEEHLWPYSQKSQCHKGGEKAVRNIPDGRSLKRHA
jgi:hypothetical protein